MMNRTSSVLRSDLTGRRRWAGGASCCGGAHLSTFIKKRNPGGRVVCLCRCGPLCSPLTPLSSARELGVVVRRGLYFRIASSPASTRAAGLPGSLLQQPTELAAIQASGHERGGE